MNYIPNPVSDVLSPFDRMCINADLTGGLHLRDVN